MRTTPIWLVALVTLWTISCSQSKPAPAPTAEQFKEWNRADVEGCRYELISKDAVENYNFGSAGLVAATLGDKKSLMGPLLHWKIEGGKVLRISGSEGRTFAALRLLSIDKEALSIEGETVRTWDEVKLLHKDFRRTKR